MKLSKQKRSTLARMNMTPMIDIVFLLIIFFMTVTQVSEFNKERYLLPNQPGSEDQLDANITVNINQNGQVIVSGRKMSLPQLYTAIGAELERVKDPNRVFITIRQDKRGNCKTTNEINTFLGGLRIKKVFIAVEVPN